jgi:hypothetical protein
VSICGSADGQYFGKRPLLKLPQQFCRHRTKLVLGISARAEVKFLRAKWELNCWRRVAQTPMFGAALDLAEVLSVRGNTGLDARRRIHGVLYRSCPEADV